jgi:methyltransferase (TIGR00027 family)
MRDHASATAILVALGMLSLAQRPQDRGASLISPSERTLLRNTLAHIGCIPAILSEGFTQVIVIGAGLDMLTLRLNRTAPGIRCIEIDHPATLAHKRQMLALASTDAHHIDLVVADLARTTVTEALTRSAHFDRSLPTLFVAEGLTMYLTPAQVRNLLADLLHAAPNARLLMTFMQPGTAGRVRFTRQTILLRLLLQLLGEPFQWGLRTTDLPDFLNASGWTLAHLSGPPEFSACATAASINFPESAFLGEYLAEASAQHRH